MSDSLNLEQLRKEAKTVLKQCRAGDRTAVDRMRAQLPRLQTLDNEQLGAQIKLGDVHHALARELGYRNWADLKRHDAPVARFLAAIRGGALNAAQRELQYFPNVANESIHVACAIGEVDAVRHHLELDPGLLTAEEGGWPPLVYACASPFHKLSLRHAFSIHECASLLLDRGADPNTDTLTDPSDPNGRMPAVVRAGMNNNRIVFLLLFQRGATGDLRAVKAAMARTVSAQDSVAQAYLKLPDDPGFREELNRRLLPIRTRRPQAPPVLSQMSIKDMLEIEHGEDATFRDSNLAFWQLAFERGVDPNSHRGIDGETPLHRFAMRRDDLGKVLAELFLTKGADPNVATADGWTPYSIAVRMGNKSMMQLLLRYGAESDSASAADQFVGACRRVDGDAARSILRSHPGLLEMIRPESYELLVDAAKNNRLEAMRLMTEVGFDVAAVGERGATALHIAAWHGYVHVVRLLVEAHTPVNIRDLVYRTSPLAWAAHGSKTSKNWREGDETDYCAVVEALINAGADYESSCNQWGVGPEEIAGRQVADLLKARGFCRATYRRTQRRPGSRAR
jgi:ankyrin repeat protein